MSIPEAVDAYATINQCYRGASDLIDTMRLHLARLGLSYSTALALLALGNAQNELSKASINAGDALRFAEAK